MAEFTCSLCKNSIMDVWQLGNDILCTKCYKKVKRDLKSGKCKICYKCRRIYYVGSYTFTVDGLEFKSNVCSDCMAEFNTTATKLFKKYGFEPDKDEIWDDINE